MQSAPAINFSTAIGPGETVSVEQRMDKTGVVRRLHTTAYSGEETDVERYFYLWEGGKENGNPVNLLTTANYAEATGNEYLAGDDQIWDLQTRRSFDVGDVLEVRYVNNDTSNAYPVDTIIEIDHETGLLSELAGRVL